MTHIEFLLEEPSIEAASGVGFVPGDENVAVAFKKLIPFLFQASAELLRDCLND